MEFGDFISSAYAGKLLADLGADVIKVEPPSGDSLRGHGPFPGDIEDPETSGLHLFLNTNKRSVTLDLDAAEGRESLLALFANADIAVHNMPVPRLMALGLDHETVSGVLPDLIMVSITVFGYDTPLRDWKGTALTATVASGICHRIGDPGRPPLWIPYSAADFQGGLHGAVSALLALRARRASGEGQHAWLSTVEIMASYLGGSGLPGYVFHGQMRGRSGKHMDAFYPWEVAETADGYYEIITMVDDQWNHFVELMGNPEWRTDERFENRWLAYQWADELDEYWHPWLKERKTKDLAKLFSENHIPFQPIHSVKEVAESDHLKARNFWETVSHPTLGEYILPGAPYKLSKSPWSIRTPAPTLGQHNRILRSDRTGSGRERLAAGGPATKPLEGLRVLDHGHVWAGPLLALGFAEMGAEVIKVQAPAKDSGISMGGRQLPGLIAKGTVIDPQDPFQYHGFDRGKQSITLDLRSEKGVALYKRLVETSDVVVENFSPGVMDDLGIGYDVLCEVNPAIILASLSATGATEGPWRDLITYGPSLSALYGIKSLLGYTDDPMPREDTADLDPTAAAHGFFAVLAALEYRERTGQGQHIDMAQGEGTLQRIAEPMMDFLFNGRIAGPQGNRYPGIAPHGIYRTAGDDAWIAISVRDDDEWFALLGVAQVGSGALASPRFRARQQRLANQDELDAALESWTSAQDATELTLALQGAGVAAYPVAGPPEMLADENFDALRKKHIELPDGSPITIEQIYTGVIWKLPKTPGVVPGPIPELAGANARVFGDVLGLTEEEQTALAAEGVI